MMKIDRYSDYAPVVLRIAVSFVLLWFGINQLVNPESFLGYLPSWLHAPLGMHDIPGFSHWVIMGNGLFEVLFGTLLILGFFTRISALLLSFHMALIAFSLGYNDIAIRDAGLALAAFSVFMGGADKMCIEKRVKLPALLRKLML